MRVDITIEVKEAAFKRGLSSEELEAEVLDEVISFVLEPCVESAAILRNDGFGRLMPDEASRRTRD